MDFLCHLSLDKKKNLLIPTKLCFNNQPNGIDPSQKASVKIAELDHHILPNVRIFSGFLYSTIFPFHFYHRYRQNIDQIHFVTQRLTNYVTYFFHLFQRHPFVHHRRVSSLRILLVL